MYDETCKLTAMTTTVSSMGDAVEAASTQTDVFCRVVSCNWKDKQIAESRGKQASITLILADKADYNNQHWLDYNSERYEIVDTYFTDSNNELRMVLSKWLGQ